VRALLAEPNGDVLAGGERLGQGGHLARYSPRTGRWRVLLSSRQEPLRRGIVTCLARDRRGRIWVGTTLGLYIIGEGGKATRLYEASALAGGFGVWSFCLAPDGVMWLGVGDVGLVRAEEDAAGELHFRVAPGPGLPPMVGTLDRDPAGRLWLGSSDTGLYCYDPARPQAGAQHVALPPGAAYDSPYIVRCDTAGQVWLGTAVGLARYTPVTRQLLVLGRQQGFLGKETNQNASTIDPDGTVWMGTVAGLMRYAPTLPGGSRRPPPVQLTGLRIFLEDTLLRPGLQLPAHLNHLTFDYLGVSLAQPDALRYRYRLTGFDEGWSRPLTTTTATYTNLPPGNYTFEVMAANGDGEWTPRPAAFSFRIAPPWWRTWWAYLLYVTAFALLLYAVRRFTQNRERERADRVLERQALTHLQELDRVKTDFFTNVSHELRTPLTLILGPAELLATEPADAAVREQGSLVLRNAKRLLTLINRLLDLSKLEAGALRLLPTSGDAARTVRQLVAAFETLAESRGIQLHFEATAEQLPLVFDEAKLEDILTNLLANALRFSPTGGEVCVRAASTAATAHAPLGGVSITVQDSGVGVVAADLPHLFDRFYQANAPTAGPLRTGTGIGLALVRELTELHGGTVAASSTPGAGAAFTVWLPAGLRPVADATLPTAALLSPVEGVAAELAVVAEQQLDTAPPLGPEAELVLIIEDSAEIREFIRTTLATEGYRLLLAANGAAGIALAQAEVPDLVVSDVMMPGLDGYEVCAQLKADPATSHVPVVLLTAKSGPEARLEGLETGADSFLAKPFAPRELRAQVRNLLALRRQVRAQVVATLQPAAVLEEMPAAVALPFMAPDPLAAHVAAVAALPSADQRFLNRLNELVLQHLDDEDFGVDQLGQEIGLSRTQLHRKLKALTGQSPGDCIRQTRLLRALALLQARVGTVAEVAYQVGFSSPNHFSTAFSRQFGYPPSAVGKELA
jgi:signal transduction histidine kinase/DNA-binding response OmpR family regulator